ncbi:alpha/beta hydrolase [Pseudonocardia asaccharolytica]|uniref:Esterase n=1 Tax=Pseudonocardia asaccharolytica DSM 44247 = NBRC 16224 TaxID=1123024 RepID=A0A511DAQ5_9PSEU|nr:alpha/beta hydrolase [Pseudonocardia asaccharolytica]GEL20038.1 esterase [Pseudonocardia asaccharolytica DSM 44247 = NBRC 16224]
MPSRESDALRAQFQQMSEILAANPQMDMATLRNLFETLHLLAAEVPGVSYEEADAGGVPALWCRPEGAATDAAIFYTHGGGFACNSMHSHRKLAGHLARAAGVPALVIDYRLAPEHPFPAQLTDALTAYRWLLDQGVPAGRIATAGDSAGGNLATALVLRLREESVPLPGAIVGLSPWYDMEHKGKTLESNAATDALVQLPILQNMSAMFLGEHGSPTDPLANPLHADVTGLPPIYLTAGGHETLLDDTERFADKARAAGVPVTLRIEPEQQHVYPYMAGRAPESDAAIADIGAWLVATLDAG